MIWTSGNGTACNESLCFNVAAAARDMLDRIRLTNRTYHFAAEFAEVGG